MGDLARRRDARDLAITRPHLAAGAVVVVLLVGLAFVGGVIVGRRAAPPVPVERMTEPELIELLARVEASKVGRGLTELTFPTALTGEAGPVPDVAPVDDEGEEIAAVPAGEVALPAQEAPSGPFTIRVATFGADEREAVHEAELTLRQMSLPVWLGAERVDGEARTYVQIGGYTSEAEAKSALEAMQEGLVASGLGVDARVIARDRSP